MDGAESREPGLPRHSRTECRRHCQGQLEPQTAGEATGSAEDPTKLLSLGPPPTARGSGWGLQRGICTIQGSEMDLSVRTGFFQIKWVGLLGPVSALHVP